MTGITAMFFGGAAFAFLGRWSIQSDGGMALGYGAAGDAYVVLGGSRSIIFSPNRSTLFQVSWTRETLWTREVIASKDTSCKGVAVDTSYNPVTVSTTSAAGSPPPYGYAGTVKYDTTGAVTWQRALSLASASVSAVGVATDSSDNVYVLARSGSTYYLAKYNSSGTLQWQRKITGTALSLTQVATDSSGNVYVGGVGSASSSYALIVKYNSSGTLQWQKNIQTASSSVQGIAVDSSGNVYFTMNDATNLRVYYAKLDSSGAFQWGRYFTVDTGYDGSAYIGSDGYIYFCNYYYTGTEFRSYIAKLNSSGTTQFVRDLYGSDVTASRIVVDTANYMWTQGGYFLGRLPNDGTATGSYDIPSYSTVTYAAATALTSGTLTIAAGSMTDAAGDLTDAAGVYTNGTFSTTAYTVVV